MSVELFQLEGKTALVFGVGPSIGSHVARAFAGAGAKVVVNARNAGVVEQLVSEIVEQHGACAAGLAGDIGSLETVDQVVSLARDRFGEVGIVFYNAFSAGAGHSAFDNPSIFDTTEEDWQECFRINVMAPFRIAKAVAPSMTGAGAFIFTLAASGFRPLHAQAVAYGSTKAALGMMMAYLGKACGPDIRFNAISPSNILTAGHTDDMKAAARAFPLGRMGAADEVTGAALFLASSASSFITGQVIFVDGGRIMIG